MQALIAWLRENFYAIWPIARVYSWQLAIRVRGGRIVSPLKPGLHLRIPCYEEIMKTPCTEIAVELPVSELTTTDGIAVKISANVAYRVTDMVKAWTTVWNNDMTIRANAHGQLMTTCAGRSWDDLNGGRATVEQLVKESLQAMAKPWGVEIVRVNLTDLAQPRYFVFGGPPPAAPEAKAVAVGLVA